MIELCGIRLAGPVLNGSGTFDAIAARRAFGDALLESFPFHAFVSKTITLAPREGNPPPRLWETPAGLINSIGLPNKGLEGFLERDLPELAELPVPLIVSVMGFSRDELATLVERVGAAEEAGADAVSLINTLKGMALDPRTAQPWLGGTTGGVSGPAVRAIALEQVRAVSSSLAIPVIGMGGIASGAHAADFLAAGAACVAVGTESFRDPAAELRIAAELGEPAAA